MAARTMHANQPLLAGIPRGRLGWTFSIVAWRPWVSLWSCRAWRANSSGWACWTWRANGSGWACWTLGARIALWAGRALRPWWPLETACKCQ
jgi:hypothetical protein